MQPPPRGRPGDRGPEDPPEVRVSRLLALMLRHTPERFELDMDDHGYAPLDQVSHALQEKFPFATVDWLRTFVEGDVGARRFAVQGDRIAARYGHSIEVEPDSAPAEPPEFLFHGTDPRHRRAILTGGILPMGRNYCHLSATVDEAREIGRRRSPRPLIFQIDAKQMQADGHLFFKAGHLFLTTKVPGRYLRVLE